MGVCMTNIAVCFYFIGNSAKKKEVESTHLNEFVNYNDS